MKKIFRSILICLVIIINCASAQITYEHTYIVPTPQPAGQEFFVTNLGNNNYKYVLWDVYNANFSLYNLDHSPYMLNIPLPVSDSGRHAIGYITTTLFDCDSTNIEYALIESSVGPGTTFLIYRTDGTQLFARDSVTTMFCVGCLGGSQDILGVVNTPIGAKLYLFNGLTVPTEFYVYGLCGILPTNITEVSQSTQYVTVYPNPTVGQINFEISPPSHFDYYNLTILNSSFQPIKTVEVKGRNVLVNLDTETLSSGTFFYSLQNKNKVIQTGKFILSK